MIECPLLREDVAACWPSGELPVEPPLHCLSQHARGGNHDQVRFEFSLAYRNAVRTFLSWPMQQKVSVTGAFDVNAVRCRFLGNAQHFVVVISQLFHHLQNDI